MRVQFATLGTSPSVVISGLNFVPFQEVHVFCDDPEGPDFTQIQTKLDGIASVHPHKVDAFDLSSSLQTMIMAIKRIEDKYKMNPELQMSINMTGGTKLLTSAILLAGYMLNVSVFYLKKKREDTLDKGELIWVPTPKISVNTLRETKREIVEILGELTEPINLTSLVNRLSLNSNQTLTPHIKSFEEDGIIEVTPEGRQKLIKLSDEGRVLYALLK